MKNKTIIASLLLISSTVIGGCTGTNNLEGNNTTKKEHTFTFESEQTIASSLHQGDTINYLSKNVPNVINPFDNRIVKKRDYTAIFNQDVTNLSPFEENDPMPYHKYTSGSSSHFGTGSSKYPESVITGKSFTKSWYYRNVYNEYYLFDIDFLSTDDCLKCYNEDFISDLESIESEILSAEDFINKYGTYVALGYSKEKYLDYCLAITEGNIPSSIDVSDFADGSISLEDIFAILENNDVYFKVTTSHKFDSYVSFASYIKDQQPEYYSSTFEYIAWIIPDKYEKAKDLVWDFYYK